MPLQDPFASFSQPPRPPITPEENLSSLRRPPATLPNAPVPTFKPAPRSPAVCTRKRRGDGKHVCAMRTGTGVSLFRGGSDVLFHPRRRQSCRTAKTYHTIVSKFAHSLISRSHSFRSVSFAPLLFLSRRLLRRLRGRSLFSLVFFLSSPLPFSPSSLRVSFSFTLYSSSRFHLSYTQCFAEGVSWYAPAKFSTVSRLRAGPEDVG